MICSSNCGSRCFGEEEEEEEVRSQEEEEQKYSKYNYHDLIDVVHTK